MKVLSVAEKQQKALALIERILQSNQFCLHADPNGTDRMDGLEKAVVRLGDAVNDILRCEKYAFELYSKAEEQCGGGRMCYTLRHYSDNAYYFVVIYQKWDQVCHWSKWQSLLKRFVQKSRFFRQVQIDIESQYVCHLYYTPDDYYEFNLSEKQVKEGVNDTNTPFMQAVRTANINAERKEYEQRKRLFEYHSYLGRAE